MFDGRGGGGLIGDGNKLSVYTNPLGLQMYSDEVSIICTTRMTRVIISQSPGKRINLLRILF
jgi:hypothetical protein